jgi:hypothetical protein
LFAIYDTPNKRQPEEEEVLNKKPKIAPLIESEIQQKSQDIYDTNVHANTDTDMPAWALLKLADVITSREPTVETTEYQSQKFDGFVHNQTLTNQSM